MTLDTVSTHTCLTVKLFPRLCNSSKLNLNRGSKSYQWEHEDASKMMFDALIDNNSIDIDRSDSRFVVDLIKGERPGPGNEKAWMFDIIANKRNSIDIDKFDYLKRDAYNCGIKVIKFDHERIFRDSMIINNEICYHQKNDFSLYQLFSSRY